MHITIDSNKLKNSLDKIAGLASNRSPKEILRNILFRVDDKVTLVATDTETTILAETPATIIKPGKMLVNCERLVKLVREFDGDMTFETVENEVVFTAPNARYKIPTSNPDEYPAVSLLAGVPQEVDSAALERAIRKTIFACEDDSARYALAGVRIEDWTVVATDGRRLSVCPVGATGEIRVTIPQRAAQTIIGILSDEKAFVSHDLNNVQVRCGGFVLNTRQLEGRFPNWQAVAGGKEGKNRATLTAGSLLTAIKQAAIVADTETRGVHFVFSEGSIALSSKTADKGQAAISVPAEYSGEQTEVKLDYKYTMAFLQTCESDDIVSVYVGQSSESVLVEDALGAGYTIMPMAMQR